MAIAAEGGGGGVVVPGAVAGGRVAGRYAGRVNAPKTTPSGAEPRRHGLSVPELPEPSPLPVSTPSVVLAGVALWAVALVITLAVPALHADDRSWWPWSCVAGVLLGLVGWAYVRRGRGNADASGG